jgi:hypothetical protein
MLPVCVVPELSCVVTLKLVEIVLPDTVRVGNSDKYVLRLIASIF